MAAVAHTFIASPNYPARALGIRSGALVRDAVKIYPDLVLVEVPRAHAEEVGDEMLQIFREESRAVEPGSMEEAFIDTGAHDQAGAVAVGHQIRQRVATELGLPVSVGVGRTKLIAKLASRAAKPDGLRLIDSLEELQLRRSLPVAELWGIGGLTASRLASIHVTHLGALDGVEDATLVRVCGTTMARRLRSIRLGTDDATVKPVEDRSSLSAELSAKGYQRPDYDLFELLARCVDRVCRRLVRADLVGTGVTVTATPLSGSRAVVAKVNGLPATNEAARWHAQARALLAETHVPPVSGLRVTVTGLLPSTHAAVPLF